mgnify:CR=1 FL=1
MKKLFKYCSLALLGCLTLTSCGDDEPELPADPGTENPDTPISPDQPVKDPVNTVTVNLANDNQPLDLGEGISIAINSSNNLRGSGYYTSLVDVGNVAGLGNITEIPTGGWKSEVALLPGHGYVARLYYSDPYSQSTHQSYARIYVVKYMESTSGGIMGAQIKYQCPFEMAISLSSTSVNLVAEEAVATLTLKNPTQVTVDEKPEWLTVTAQEQTLTFTATANYSATARKGVVKISNSLGSVNINVTQAASSSPLFAAGSGTVADPYQIATAAQLANIRFAPGAHFVQTADIDLASFIDPAGSGWEPIGGFRGSYDGQFHKITGLWINRPTTDNIGLFSTIDRQSSGENAEITGVMLELGERGITGSSYVAGICGSSSYLNISKCSVSGNITGESEVSGIVNNSDVSQCRVLGNITATGNYVTANGLTSRYAFDSYFVGTIESGYRAYAFGTRATNCYVVGEMPTAQSTRLASDYTSHCYGWGNVTDEEMKLKSTYEGWDFTTVWKINDGVSYPTLRCFPD